MFSMRNIVHVTSITVVLILNHSIGDNKWCDKEFSCEINGAVVVHTMCKNFPKDKQGPFDKITRHSTESSKKLLLKAHNAFRNMLSTGWTGLPEASNIRQMTWDTTLEELATNWAMQCNPGHDSCRKTHEFLQVGQNIDMVTYQKESATIAGNIFEGWKQSFIKSAHESWVNSIIQSFKDGSWRNGTQLAWAETAKVGCGEVTCHQSQSLTNFRVLVCNYGPSGNLEKQEIYKLSNPCEQCSKGTQCKEESDYPNLCALPNDPLDSSLGILDPQTEHPATTEKGRIESTEQGETTDGGVNEENESTTESNHKIQPDGTGTGELTSPSDVKDERGDDPVTLPAKNDAARCSHHLLYSMFGATERIKSYLIGTVN